MHDPARAQAVAGDVFERDYFAAGLAHNAYEMLMRVPGFSIVETDGMVRGYASAQGNVLIDGARPSSKREKIGDLLKRIPAASVERIELIRSGASGIDMAGHAVLANVVRAAHASSEGAVELGAIAASDGWHSVPGKLEYARRWPQDRAFEFSAGYAPTPFEDSGDGRVRTLDGDGNVLADDKLGLRSIEKSSTASAGWRQPLAGGQLRLTSSLRHDRWFTGFHRFGVDERIDTDEREDETEFGARWQRRIGEKTTLETLATRRDNEYVVDARSREDALDESYGEDNRMAESIGRLELGHERNTRLTLTASLEAARNTLDGDTRLLSDGVPVPLPEANASVAETRYEAAAGFAWQAGETLRLEAAMRFERSRIEHGGDHPLQRQFSYPKPRASLRWDVGENDRLRFSLSREVGQLYFGDFVAKASLDAGTVSAGNAQLVPDRSWQFSAEWERSFGDEAALTLAWTHDRIEDVMDRVLVVADDEIFDAPGNIGDGRRDALQLDFNAPLERIGLQGGRIRASLKYAYSRVTDPVTGHQRGISEEAPVEGEIELSQDLPAWRANWGLLLENVSQREAAYRFDEVQRKSSGAGWTLYAERRLGAHWRLRGEARELFGRDFTETFDRFEGPRSQMPLAEREIRDRRKPGIFVLTLRREFGG
ncbi:MAG: TonB-dependent receptor [Pseudoxanthomonas sp.]